MRSITITTLALLTAAFALSAFTHHPSDAMAEEETLKDKLAKEDLGSKKPPRKVLRHVVLFKFKKEASKAQIKKVVTEFAALPSKIDTIIGFEKGTDVSVEGKAKGFTHGFVVTFANEKGREIYLPHPAHKAFVKIVGPVLDDVLVFDYWTVK